MEVPGQENMKDVNFENNTPTTNPFTILNPSNAATDPTTVQSVAQPSVTSKPTDHVGPSQKRPKTQVAGEVLVVEKDASNRFKSQAWNHFTIVKGSDPIRATCNYCGKNYAANPSNNGTRNLFSHLNNQCTKVP